jgi:hypothetical protein
MSTFEQTPEYFVVNNDDEFFKNINSYPLLRTRAALLVIFQQHFFWGLGHDFTWMVVSVLRAAHFRVLSAHSGPEALELQKLTRKSTYSFLM